MPTDVLALIIWYVIVALALGGGFAGNQALRGQRAWPAVLLWAAWPLVIVSVVIMGLLGKAREDR